MPNRSWARRFAFSLAILAFPLLQTGLAFADGGDNPFEKKVDGYHVELVLKEHARVGSNKVSIRLSNPQGKPVTGAHIEAVVRMHSEPAGHSSGTDGGGHEQAPGARQPAAGADVHATGGHDESAGVALNAGHESGEYEGMITFGAAGEWLVKVSLVLDGQTREVDFNVPVSGSTSKWAVLGGFLGLNSIVIVAAAILKRKSVTR